MTGDSRRFVLLDRWETRRVHRHAFTSGVPNYSPVDAERPARADVTLLGWPLAAYVIRLVHQLARRWLVLVPAGLVIAARRRFAAWDGR